MKKPLKKASLTVASMCLVAGGLVSVGWAGAPATAKRPLVKMNSAVQTSKKDENMKNGAKHTPAKCIPCQRCRPPVRC